MRWRLSWAVQAMAGVGGTLIVVADRSFLPGLNLHQPPAHNRL
jgi:hypothetical protein